MTKTLYYAVNADGRGILFTERPERDDKLRIWCGNTNGYLSSVLQYLKDEGFDLPRIIYKDDPVLIKITTDYA